MISKEQIEKNKSKLIETSEKYGVLSTPLLEFLGEDLFVAPASTSLDMYGAYPGGLLEHIFVASKYAVKVNSILPESLQQDISSLLKCTILSQIGKVFLFKPNESEWHRNKLGKMYEFSDDLVLIIKSISPSLITLFFSKALLSLIDLYVFIFFIFNLETNFCFIDL